MGKFNQYFTGKYLKFWYAAFAVTLIWFALTMFNNGGVKKYELTIFNAKGEVVRTMVMDRTNWKIPETLPMTKVYRPIKPIGGK